MREGNSSVLSYADAMMHYDAVRIHLGWIDSTLEKNNRKPELSKTMIPVACNSGCLCRSLDNDSGYSDEWRSYTVEHITSSVCFM